MAGKNGKLFKGLFLFNFMARGQARSKRKSSGGRYRDYRKKKYFELARDPTHTKLGEVRSSSSSIRGGGSKPRLLSANVVNVYDPKQKKYVRTKILTVVDNVANRHFIRRNIMTRGALVKTELGNAKITSRPGQEKMINAVLVSEKN